MNGGLNTLYIRIVHIQEIQKQKKSLRLDIGREEIYVYKMLRDSCKDM